MSFLIIKMKTHKAIFLDRDGVINEDSGYVHKIEDLVILPEVPEALKILKKEEYKLIVVTNQSGIGRGLFTSADFMGVTREIERLLFLEGVTFDSVYYCPHHPEDNCNCRKPNPGMFLRAIRDFNLDTEQCWMIGDKLSDIEPADKLGIKSILIESQYNRDFRGFKRTNLYEAAQYILENE